MKPPLTIAGIAFLAVSLGLLVALLLDSQTVLGINRWIKPLKFALSIAVFLLTISWVVKLLEAGSGQSLAWAGWVMMMAMVIEQVLITFQAARGVPSHFNISSGLNAAIYSFMGTAIFINTLVLGYLTLKVFQLDGMAEISPATFLALRYGLILLVLGSLQGMYMSASGHSIVGGAHSGVGLPFLNWSTLFGDLRIAHFIALHGIQVLLVVAYVLSLLSMNQTWPVHFVAGFILLLTTLAQLQAMAGKPLVG